MDSGDHTDAPRCTATAKGSRQRCKRRPIPGGTVCVKHGGGAPQVQAKAEERLKALIHPAITRLHELIAQTEYPSVAIAAVKDALDRNGQLGKAAEKPLQVNLNIADERVRRLNAAREKAKSKA
jgi:hypothetical protein